MPYFQAYMNIIGGGTDMRPEALMDNISVLLKEGKDPASYFSFRPISLIN